ncbi:MAG TPA: hypothetical protein VHC98_01220 [Candidatus Saccharimonadales bacterium]|nr:hypothetical protein [Candidatus Saccharimonadales bacterium]
MADKYNSSGIEPIDSHELLNDAEEQERQELIDQYMGGLITQDMFDEKFEGLSRYNDLHRQLTDEQSG